MIVAEALSEGKEVKRAVAIADGDRWKAVERDAPQCAAPMARKARPPASPGATE